MHRLPLAVAAALVTSTFAAPVAIAATGPAGPATPPAGSGETPALTTGLSTVVHRARPAAAARTYLATHRSTYRIVRPATDLRLLGSSTTHGVTATRFAQRYHGAPVLGGEYVVRMRDRGDRAVITGTSGHYFGHLDVDVHQQLPLDLASRVVRYGDARTVGHLALRDRGMVVLPFGRGLLTRHLTETGIGIDGQPVQREVYVAPGISRPVLSYSSIETDGPIDTTGVGFHDRFFGDTPLPIQAYQAGSSYELKDTTRGDGIETYDAHGMNEWRFENDGITKGPKLVTSTTIPFTENTSGAIDAHWGAERVYDFYHALGRNGLDGKGGKIISVVGVTEGGDPFPNAFWNGSEMVYGKGGYGYRDFASALDVVGHEMTHGVVQHTAGLLYFGQSGALNEGIADYFGNAIENDTLGIDATSPLDGLMGQDLCTNRTEVHCHDRDLDKVRTTRQFRGNVFDNGNVHENSQIASGAFWAGRHILGDALGDRVMYVALSQYLTPFSDFLDARRSYLAAAAQEGVTGAQLAQLRHAFDVRGITAGWQKRVMRVDGTALYPGMSLGYSMSAGGGRWVAMDAGPRGERLPSIYTGRVNRVGHRLVSPNRKHIYDTPATDGKRVVWSSFDMHGVLRIQTRKLSGGPVHTLAAYHQMNAVQTAIDGSTVAWHVFGSHGRDWVVVRRNGHDHVVQKAGRTTFVAGPSAKGNHVVWGTSSYDGDAARLREYDLKTGRTTTLASQPTTRAFTPSGILFPTIAGQSVFFVDDPGHRSGHAAIARIDLDGKHLTKLIPASSKRAPVAPYLTASAQAVTYQSFAGASLHATMRQIPATGGSSRPVSCARGEQEIPAAAGGTRVLWIDFSTGSATLTTRARPAGHC